jgi:hypothetical protein
VNILHDALSLLCGQSPTSLLPLHPFFDQRLRLYPVQSHLIVVSGVSLHLGRQALGFLRMCSDFDSRLLLFFVFVFVNVQ